MKDRCPICDSKRYDSRRGFLRCNSCGFAPADHSPKGLNDFQNWYENQRAARLAVN